MKKCRNLLKSSLILLLLFALVWGFSRVYFFVTDGFDLSNIKSEFSYDPRWESHRLSSEQQQEVKSILSQEFRYLGKGCQSYVFQSEDGEYVLKFFKYQRFRSSKFWNDFSFIPAVAKIREQKIQKKTRKLELLFNSWKTAFDYLKNETGLIYVHLNKTEDLNQTLTLFDKIGRIHQLEADQMEFLIQRKADMICPTLHQWMKSNRQNEAKQLLIDFVQLVVSEYQRGLADSDHALMQNTGVCQGKPMHVDVGQFSLHEKFKDPDVYLQELYNKTFKFRIWLERHYPDLLQVLDQELQDVMGDRFYTLKFIPRTIQKPI